MEIRQPAVQVAQVEAAQVVAMMVMELQEQLIPAVGVEVELD